MISQVRLLADEPTTQDEFGTHSRIANAVGELITTEKAGKAVALTGPWGSGKSSVLRILQTRLAGVADVFIFDAWTHEGDPLRRTFLQTLIDFLHTQNPSVQAEEVRDQITLRKKVKEETTAPVLTWEARVLGVLLLAVPIGLAMFAAMIRMPHPSWPWTIAALIIALLPILHVIFLGLGAGLRRVMTTAFHARKSRAVAFALAALAGLVGVAVLYRMWLPEQAEQGLTFLVAAALTIVLFAIFRPSTSGIIPVLLNRTVTSTKSESIDSSEPSSIEFQGWFRSIVALHQKTQAKKLVIAVDNLDRVDAQLARQLWATMRTFFDFSSDGQAEDGQIWLIAAFDKGAIHKVWELDPDSFINKTFQASFSVPSLVLIHRDDYLKRQLTKAFPFQGEPLLEPVVLLYALKHAGEISTPRNIINFVNSVGSIHRQWRQNEIPLLHQAQYVLAAESGGTGIMSILSASGTNSWAPEELVGPDWRESLAAIHFNVPKRDVAHVFMPSVILDGLLSGEGVKFAELLKIRGFGEVLSEVVIHNAAAWKEPHNLTNAILALDSLKLSDSDNGVVRSWRILTAAAFRVEKWDASPATGSALAVLIRRSANDNDLISKLLRSAGRAMPRTREGRVDDSESALIGFVKALAPVFDLLLMLPLSFQINLYGSAGDYLKVLNALDIVRPRQFTDISLRLDTDRREDIPGVLAEWIRGVELKGDFSEVIRALDAHYPDMDWQPVISAAESIFANRSNNLLQKSFMLTFETLLVLSNSHEGASKSLEALAANGTLYHYLGASSDPQSTDLALLMILLFADLSDPIAHPGNAKEGVAAFQTSLARADEKSLARIATLIAAFDLWPRLKSREERSGLLKAAVRNALRSLAERSEMYPALNKASALTATTSENSA